MKFKLFKFRSVTSTNDMAISLIKKKKLFGCVHSKIQTKGRGTYGKKWISRKGNLFISLFFPIEKKLPPFNEFLTINTVIISDIIKKFCNKKKVRLKFPNDIFINKKKVCGVLQELITLKNKKFLIIGIGINIISNPKINNLYQSTNMYLETNKKLSIISIINLIVTSYENFFIELSSYKYENYKKKAESLLLK